jgi:hypothetical protein
MLPANMPSEQERRNFRRVEVLQGHNGLRVGSRIWTHKRFLYEKLSEENIPGISQGCIGKRA